jgi:hypothetical protein
VDYWGNWVKDGFNQLEKHVWLIDSLLTSLKGMDRFEAIEFATSNS